MSIMSYSGGTVVAMTGDECYCIGTDLRMGERMTTIATNIKKVYKITDKIYIGLSGFASDGKTIYDKIINQKDLYQLRENKNIKPKVVATIISNLLYSRRFGPYFIEPIIAGLDPVTNKPYIASTDLIGSLSEPKDFLAIGTGSEYCLGVCEGFWREGMNPDELFEATAQALLSGIERDGSSGYGAIIYTVTKDKVNIKSIKTRMD